MEQFMRKREFELRLNGKLIHTIWAKDSEAALDIIFDEMLFDVTEEPQTKQDYLDEVADHENKYEKENN